MKFSKRQTGEKYEVFDVETGLSVPDGLHGIEMDADTHLQRLQTEESAALAKAAPIEDLAGQPLPRNVFIPITKIDEERREVWGWAAMEEPDHAGEIMDYASSKPYFERWSQSAQKRTGGSSFGNVREMHKPLAAGKLIAMQLDDERRGVFVGSKVVDDAAWNKVRAGVYTGYSIGGSYAKRWRDQANPNLNRYTADPNEISLVDAPCIPSATFQIIKRDGSTEDQSFAPGNAGESLPVSLDEGLEKIATPTSPEPSGIIPGWSEDVERMPDQDRTMLISPTNPPDGDTLAGRHLGVQDVSAAAAEATSGETHVTKARVIHTPQFAKVRRPAPRMVKAVP